MDVATLVQLEALRLLKARYCRFCDTKDWPRFFALFTDDAVFDVRAGASATPQEGEGEFAEMGYQVGRAAIAAGVHAIAASIGETVHHCHTPEIELTSPDTATGIWALEDQLHYIAGPIKRMHGFGHYHETYVREAGQWRIKTLRLTRLRVHVVMAEDAVAA